MHLAASGDDAVSADVDGEIVCGNGGRVGGRRIPYATERGADACVQLVQAERFPNRLLTVRS
jgi:hypothetical protein